MPPGSAEALIAAKVAFLAEGGAASLGPLAPEGLLISALATTVASLIHNALHGRISLKAEGWNARRVWTALNVVNHGIYAALFVIRSLFYTGTGSSDRPFYYESYFLGWLCGPSWFLPTLLGWNNHRYNQPVVLKWMTWANSPTSDAYPEWIAPYISDPSFMYYYQIAEGSFHFMIVLGGLCAFSRSAWPPKEGSAWVRSFRWGLWLELVLMDITYCVAFSCMPFMGVPGHWGLTTIMMLIHHINVLPDFVCAWYEWVAAREARVAVSRPGMVA